MAFARYGASTFSCPIELLVLCCFAAAAAAVSRPWSAACRPSARCECRLLWSEIARTTLRALECRGDLSVAEWASHGRIADEVESFVHVGGSVADGSSALGSWSHLRSLTKLRSLRLERSAVALSTVPPFDGLITLSISGGNLTTLPAREFARIAGGGLKSLVVSGCAVRCIVAEAFAGLAGLLKLDLSANAIDGSLLARRFDGLASLKILDLSNNAIEDLTPDAFAALPRLEELRLTNNALRHLDAGAFASLHNLRLLYVDWNPLPFFAADQLLSGDGHRLLALDVSGIAITRLDSYAFFGVNVTRIAVSECRRLRYIARRAFYALPETEAIEISGCPQLTFVHEDAFSQLPALKVLTLRENGLLAPPAADQFRQLPSLVAFAIDRNRFSCDCSVNWLVDYASLVHREGEGGNGSRRIMADVESTTCSDERGVEWPLLALSSHERADTCRPRMLYPAATADAGDAEASALGAHEGDCVTLACHAAGVPVPTVRWHRDGRPVPTAGNGDQYHVDDGGRLLVIFPARVGHSGAYACTAANERGSASARFDLTVLASYAGVSLIAVGSNWVAFAIANATRGRPYHASVAEVGRGGASSERVLPLAPALASHNVSGLRARTSYRLCLLAPPPSAQNIACLAARTLDDGAAKAHAAISLNSGGASWLRANNQPAAGAIAATVSALTLAAR